LTNVTVTDTSYKHPEKLSCLGTTCTNNTNIFYSRLLKLIGSMELVHCAILLAVIFQANCDVSVSQKSIEVRTGDEAHLSCTTSSEIAFCTFKSPSGDSHILRKGIKYEDGRITYFGEDTATECGVKILNVLEKDNGVWTCAITTLVDSAAINVEETISVIVSKPPSEVRIEVDGVPTSNMVVNFRDSKSRQVSCVSDGARPAATFSWMLGEDVFQGPVEDMEAVQHEDGSLKQVQVLKYEAEPSHNGKALTCIVNHNGFTRQDMEMNKNMATLDLDVQFQPVAADRPQGFFKLKVGQPKEILMNFRAHPRPTQVLWTMYDATEVNEGGESLDGRYKALVLEEGPNDGQFTAKLIINSVSEEDAGTKSQLSVTNELGTTIYPFTLSLGDEPKSAGTGPVVAIVIVAIIIILVIVVAVIARSQGMLCFADPPRPEEDKEKAVEKEEGSETESAKGEEHAKDETDDAIVDDTEMINNNKEPKKSMGSKVSSFLSAMKKSVGSRKEKYSEGGEELQEGKENGVETDERKDDSIVYADLDKSAMSATGALGAKVSIENETTTYADIKPDTKEK